MSYQQIDKDKIDSIIKNRLTKFIIKHIADKGNYKLNINYMFNNIISTTNLFINIV
jgi:hypothetical protein